MFQYLIDLVREITTNQSNATADTARQLRNTLMLLSKLVPVLGESQYAEWA